MAKTKNLLKYAQNSLKSRKVEKSNSKLSEAIKLDKKGKKDLRIRKIENGYILSTDSVGKNGFYETKEYYLKTNPIKLRAIK